VFFSNPEIYVRNRIIIMTQYHSKHPAVFHISPNFRLWDFRMKRTVSQISSLHGLQDIAYWCLLTSNAYVNTYSTMFLDSTPMKQTYVLWVNLSWWYDWMSWLALLLHIQEVLVSYLSPETAYPDWGFLWFSWVLPSKCWDSALIRALTDLKILLQASRIMYLGLWF
jgi:hypothetical protein